MYFIFQMEGSGAGLEGPVPFHTMGSQVSFFRNGPNTSNSLPLACLHHLTSQKQHREARCRLWRARQTDFENEQSENAAFHSSQ